MFIIIAVVWLPYKVFSFLLCNSQFILPEFAEQLFITLTFSDTRHKSANIRAG